MIYLLHLSPGLPRSNGTVLTHYLGWCHDENILSRVEAHRKGRSGAKLVEEHQRRGGTVRLVATWPGGGPGLERYLKDAGHLKKHCPLCREQEVERKKRADRERARLKRGLRQLPLPGLARESGIASPPPGRPTPASASGTSRAEPPPASSTPSGATARERGIGTTSSTATAPPASPNATGSAGTRQPST